MIDVKNSSDQSIDIIGHNTSQDVEVTQNPEQEIDIVNADSAQDVEILQTECNQGIQISIPCPAKLDLQIAIDSKVPKALSILPKATFDTFESRSNSRVYVEADGTPSFATVEQIKQLGTKTIYVDELNDKKIDTLSSEDIILLRKE